MSEQMYPPDWPRCPVCGDFALDGHITCGRAICAEANEREKEEERWRENYVDESDRDYQ